MSRRRRATGRRIFLDPIHDSVTVSKFINNLMYDGKKGKAEKIFYDSLQHIQDKVGEENSFDYFLQALENVKPNLEVRSRRVGGSTYQVPVDVREQRRVTLAIRWLISNARKRNGNSMVDNLSGEIIDAYNNRGNSIKKKEETHKMAEANRAFSHYIW